MRTGEQQPVPAWRCVFPTVLTAEDLKELQNAKERSAEFKYNSLGGYEGAFCGYAGYGLVRMSTVDGAFIANLVKAYQQIREFRPREFVEMTEGNKKSLKETNGVYVLFYPRSFDLSRYRIGLQYNEQWVEECVKFGHRPEHLRLCCLVDDTEAIEQSWRDSTRVPPLSFTRPETKIEPGAPAEEPITINGPVKALVLESRSLKDYFRPTQRLTIRVVDSDSVTHFVYEKGDWVEPRAENSEE